MAYTWETHKAKLADQWAKMKILRQRSEMERVAKKLIARKAIYQEAEQETGVPWWMIAVIDLREGGESHLCTRHLHCGDPLTNYTVHVPAGRPQVGHGPPFTWLESAVDALRMKRYPAIKDWPIERVLHELEPYNGLGWFAPQPERAPLAYYQRGIPSPYIWSCTNIYDPPYGPGGKYTADHVFTSGYVDPQVGCAPLIKVMADLDRSIMLQSYRDGAVPPPPDIEPIPQPSPKGEAGLIAIIAGMFAAVAGFLYAHPLAGVVMFALVIGLAIWWNKR